jgi:uncharacterized membrane protein
MAGIGSLLLVVGTFVPFLGLVGLILLLVGMKSLSEYYKDAGIWHDALYGIVFGFIGLIATAFVVLAIFGFAVYTPFGPGAGILGIIVGAIAFLVIVLVFLILMAVYFKRAFNQLASRTGVGMFNTAGMLLLIGAVLTIILIGFVLIFIAWILLTVAFFSISTTSQQQMLPPPPMQQTSQ